MNYFSKFNLKPEYDIDLEKLEEKYLAYQLAHHPDSQSNQPVKNHIDNLQNSIDINKAYEVLKSDLHRAEHLLELKGFAMDCASSKDYLSTRILTEAFEDRQELDSMKSKEDINDLLSKIQLDLDDCKNEFKKYYQKNLLEKAKEAVLRMRYKSKLLQDIIIFQRTKLVK